MKRSIVVITSLILFAAGGARAQEAAPPATAPADAAAGDDLPGLDVRSKFDFNRTADELVAKYDKDPLGRITEHMGAAAELLAQLNTNEPTQPKQQIILANLDKYIEMLEKREKKVKAGGGANPNRPLPDSVIAKGPGGQGDMNDPANSVRNWGQLPPKQREQILQSQNEGFPSGYESILSSYYRRLAQESVDSPAPTAAAAAPTTGAASSR